MMTLQDLSMVHEIIDRLEKEYPDDGILGLLEKVAGNISEELSTQHFRESEEALRSARRVPN